MSVKSRCNEILILPQRHRGDGNGGGDGGWGLGAVYIGEGFGGVTEQPTVLFLNVSLDINQQHGRAVGFPAYFKCPTYTIMLPFLGPEPCSLPAKARAFYSSLGISTFLSSSDLWRNCSIAEIPRCL